MVRDAAVGYRWLGALGCGLLVGCSGEDAAPPQVDTTLPGPTEWNREVTPPSDEEAAAARLSCDYSADMLPAETHGASTPSGSDIPIDHILVVMMENRSFDHYFQKLPEYGQADVDVAPSDFSNPDVDGVPVPIFKDDVYCFVDTPHGYQSIAEQIGDGAMDGFARTAEGSHELPAGGSLDMLSGRRAMGYYDETDLPFYYWLASEFAIGDRYFSSVPTSTWPNRMYSWAATSFGWASNDLAEADKTLPDYLDLREVSWKLYSSTTPTYAFFLSKYLALEEGHVVPFEEYYSDLENGTLPQVAFVEPAVGRGGFDQNDEHPPAIMQLGQEFSAQVIQALTKSQYWSRSALFITYDEHGGLYDHVEPPPACPPDDLVEPLANGTLPRFDRYGVRVPFIVVSPFAKKHYVSHRIYDHTSIVRFIQARFVIPALTARDANAEAPWDMFDFENPAHLEPPAINLPPVDADVVAACQAIYEP